MILSGTNNSQQTSLVFIGGADPFRTLCPNNDIRCKAEIFLPDVKCIVGIGCTGVEQGVEIISTIPVLKWLKWLKRLKKADEAVGMVDDAARAATNRPKLRRVHSDETLTTGSARYDYEDVKRMSTEDIIKSLKPGAKEPLTVKPDGTIIDGNTRILVLEERGIDVNSLPRVEP